jgi:ABC-type nitrate/sulfonate/bicarbonate transport system substrate-binding protein
MTKDYPDKVKAFWKGLEKQLAEVKATPAYQLAQEDRKQLIDFSEAILQKVRNLKADDKADNEARQQGDQAATDQTETTSTAKQGQDTNQTAQ